jgi:hypothetical protein
MRAASRKKEARYLHLRWRGIALVQQQSALGWRYACCGTSAQTERHCDRATINPISMHALTAPQENG